MKRLFYAFCALAFCLSATSCDNKESLAKLVDPMIGTDFHAHTFPGAALPHGMVQLSPDNGPGGWDWCGGYHTSDPTIIGFSHTHISGTGVRDLCDITIMPQVGEPKFEFGTMESPSGYRSRIDHATEKAEAGYYSVYLEDPKILAEVTASLRCGYHRYTFDNPENQYVVIDFNYSNGNVTRKAEFRVVDNRTIEGVRYVNGWAPKREVYFYAVFSEPFSEVVAEIDGQQKGAVTEGEGRKVTLAAKFNKPTKQISIQVGISSTSCEGAKKNYESEIKGKSFNKVYREAQAAWDAELSKIDIKTDDATQKKIFYTSLYHSMMAPIIFSDVDGKYRGIDGKIHESGEDGHYTLFSFWDTFRAAHPLYSIIEPERNESFVRSIIEKWKQFGMLPMWELHCADTRCMIGYHAASVIADAYMKGYRNFDAEEALKAMIATAERDEFGIKYVKELGYIPADKEGSSVSKAVEYAYDDWCIALMAKELSKEDVYNRYITRAQYYKNYYDPTDSFLKGRYSNGKFTHDVFDANVVYHGHYVEGNAWHYAFFAPHDVNGHIDLMGGEQKYIAKLDEMFNAPTPEGVGDVTGNIGQYSHGNEPSHHAAYLYAYAGEPWKTQKWVKRIIDEMYTDTRSGICGNEDCGQMSAWYILSTMGFYQIAPASNTYVLGTPRFPEATINLTNGKQFKVVAEAVSNENFYVQKVTWNGQAYEKNFITHDMITSGGELRFVMGPEPNKAFGSAPESRPVARITDRVMSPEQLMASPAKH